jgi:hypothetical protein
MWPFGLKEPGPVVPADDLLRLSVIDVQHGFIAGGGDAVKEKCQAVRKRGTWYGPQGAVLDPEGVNTLISSAT